MKRLSDAISRLRAWIRDYGHEKQPAFIEDLQTVLDVFESSEERKTRIAAATAEVRDKLAESCQLISDLLRERMIVERERDEFVSELRETAKCGLRLAKELIRELDEARDAAHHLFCYGEGDEITPEKRDEIIKLLQRWGEIRK